MFSGVEIVGSPGPLSASISGMHIVGSSSQPPLTSIAERRSGSGEESEDDEDDEDGGWRAGTVERGRGSQDETVLMSGYLWKKGERRKVWDDLPRLRQTLIHFNCRRPGKNAGLCSDQHTLHSTKPPRSTSCSDCSTLPTCTPAHPFNSRNT